MRLLLVSAILFLSVAGAQEPPAIPHKVLELDWEPVEGAEGYEVKLTPVPDGAPLVFSVKENSIQQDVPTGKYKLQIRSQASIDTYSPWSDAVEIDVANKFTVPLTPADGALVTAVDTKNVPVEFSWSPVEKVKEYTVKVWSESRKDKPWVFTTRSTRKLLNIPPGEIYYWQVFFDSSNSVTYNQNPPLFTFTLQGMMLVRPEITTKVVFGDVKLFTWKKSPGAKEYGVKLYFRYLDETDYSLVREEKVAASQLDTQKLLPGQYKLEVQARAPVRAPSEWAEFEFVIKPSEAELAKALAQSP